MSPDRVPDAPFADLEQEAVHLARTAGNEIVSTLNEAVDFEYKSGHASGPPSPVTEVDVAIEASQREHLARRFPAHGVLGEEFGGDPQEEFVWALDPIDGTSNFLWRFPCVTVSVGCVRHGVPVAGAVWCSVTPELRPGVFHARAGGEIALDGVPLRPRSLRQALQRPLVGTSGARPLAGEFDLRTTGSAAFDCVLAAVGILRAAHLGRLHVWDVAGGLVLLAAAGRRILVSGSVPGWHAFERFEAPLPTWREELLVGEDGLVRRLQQRIDPLAPEDGRAV